MLNRCEFIGNVCAEIDLKYTQSGAAVANFTVAATERWKDKNGQKQERTEFVRVVAWNKQAELAAEYLHKGSKVYVSGSMETRKWQDQQGNDRYTTEIKMRDMIFLDSPNQRNQQDDKSPSDYVPPSPGMGEDVPF